MTQTSNCCCVIKIGETTHSIVGTSYLYCSCWHCRLLAHLTLTKLTWQCQTILVPANCRGAATNAAHFGRWSIVGEEHGQKQPTIRHATKRGAAPHCRRHVTNFPPIKSPPCRGTTAACSRSSKDIRWSGAMRLWILELTAPDKDNKADLRSDANAPKVRSCSFCDSAYGAHLSSRLTNGNSNRSVIW